MHLGLVIAILGTAVCVIDFAGLEQKVDTILERGLLGMKATEKAVEKGLLRNAEDVFYALNFGIYLFAIAVFVPLIASSGDKMPEPDPANL